MKTLQTLAKNLLFEKLRILRLIVSETENALLTLHKKKKFRQIINREEKKVWTLINMEFSYRTTGENKTHFESIKLNPMELQR